MRVVQVYRAVAMVYKGGTVCIHITGDFGAAEIDSAVSDDASGEADIVSGFTMPLILLSAPLSRLARNTSGGASTPYAPAS